MSRPSVADRPDAPTLELGGRTVGRGQPTFVIAEMSANHNNDLQRALELVNAAHDAGADAVKLQTYTPDSMTLDSDLPRFRVGGGTLWDGRTLYELYAEGATPMEWHSALKDEADRIGICLFSTPFDANAVTFLAGLDVPAFKIASFELIDLELIAAAAQQRRPLIMSTGMANVDEIDDAVTAARAAGTDAIALLRCTSAYPADPADMDLRTIVDMERRWHLPIGLSDHTLSHTAAIAAVTLGACIIEKHFTLSRSDPGPDSAFSLEPDELRELVSAIRETEAALGHVRYGPAPGEEASLAFRRSLTATSDIAANELLTRANVASLRPAGGIAPSAIEKVLGSRASRPIKRGEPLTWDDVSPKS